MIDLFTCTCANCGHHMQGGLLNPQGGQIAYGETHFHSGLFNPDRKPGEEFILCKICHELEERKIESLGTNNIPNLLRTYTPSQRKKPAVAA